MKILSKIYYFCLKLHRYSSNLQFSFSQDFRRNLNLWVGPLKRLSACRRYPPLTYLSEISWEKFHVINKKSFTETGIVLIMALQKKPNPSRGGDGKPRVLSGMNRQPGCLGRATRLFLWEISTADPKEIIPRDVGCDEIGQHPVPGAVRLLGSGLAGLEIRRQKRR